MVGKVNFVSSKDCDQKIKKITQAGSDQLFIALNVKNKAIVFNYLIEFL